MSCVWLSVILWSTWFSFAQALQLSTRFMSWSTMTALSICFHHFTDSAALLRNCINCISAPFWITDCACPTVEKCREQPCLTWLYISCVYERFVASLIHMYRFLFVYLVCLYIQCSVHLSVALMACLCMFSWPSIWPDTLWLMHF